MCWSNLQIPCRSAVVGVMACKKLSTVKIPVQRYTVRACRYRVRLPNLRQQNGAPIFIKTTGETALAVDNKQLKGHGKSYHKDGFSSPVGKLKSHDKPLEDFTPDDLKAAGIEPGKEISLTFESGITVSGKLDELSTEKGKIILLKVEKCTVLDEKGRVLFDPSWGVYDMAIGEKITSVFCGAADKDAFLEIAYKSNTGTHHADYDHNTKELHKLYQQVRNRRHTGGDLWLFRQRMA
jgi:phenylalanine-4-hydroxylase